MRGVWITDETLPRVFDISSQSKQNLRSKRRSKLVEIYAYDSNFKTGYIYMQTIVAVVFFFVLT